jgi:hypothetical protein
MADNSGVVLPKELRLAPPATMPQSRSYMFKQQAALSGYKAGETIQINLPRLQRSYLTKDSYLEFEVEFTHTISGAADAKTQALQLDVPGALGLINRIEVYDYLGSTQLESTSGFGQLAALLHDASTEASEQATHYEVVSGTNQPVAVFDWDRGAVGPKTGSVTSMNPMRTLQPVVGELIDRGGWANDFQSGTQQAAQATDTTGGTRVIRRRYHLPLFSFLGLLSPKFAPLHNGYTIMITLQTDNAAMICAALKPGTDSQTAVTGNTASFRVVNARMCCQILELGPIAESMLLSTTGGQPMIVTTKAYRYFNTSFADKTSNFKLDLNINVASLTNIMWIMRPTTFVNDPTLPSLSHRQRNFLTSWYFQYGSSILPQTNGITAFKPINNQYQDKDWGSECLIEFLKSRHAYNQANQTHCFNKWNWAYDNPVRALRHLTDRIGAGASIGAPITLDSFKYAVANSVYEHGKFACGLDLELVSGRTNEIICGMNTNGMNTAIFATFDATAATQAVATSGNGIFVEGCNVDAWCEYDAFVNVSPGIATTISF